MKRVGNLFEKTISFSNLTLAAKTARQGCGRSMETARFFYRLEPELLHLQKELRKGRYIPGGHRYFKVYDPKERTIAVAPFRDRVVHHALVNILEPIYERCFIFDTYATRKAKGTHAAVSRAQYFLRKNRWYLKADIHKYFDSVDHDILLTIIRRKIKDDRLNDVLEGIIRKTPTFGKGLPIGNLTSQFLANVYLDALDHRIKDHWSAKHYLRYMDDFVLFSNKKADLLNLRQRIQRFLWRELQLELKPGGVWLNQAGHGLSFLGVRIFRGAIRHRSENKRRSLKRMHNKVQDWIDGKIDEDALAASLTSALGHLRHFSPGLAAIP